jgi:hypothetical protein
MGKIKDWAYNNGKVRFKDYYSPSYPDPVSGRRNILTLGAVSASVRQHDRETDGRTG